MKYLIVSVKDSKVGFGGLRLCPNKEVAKRDFSMLFSDPGASIYTLNPSDFDLYYVGDFDSTTGIGSFLPVPELLYQGTDFVK